MFGCLVIARLNSSRLPNKNILEINKKPMIINLVERLSKSNFLDKIIICTSNEKTDDPLEIIAKQNNVNIFRGSLNNIMNRIIECANYYNITDIVEILGDNPLINHELLDYVLEDYIKNKQDYSTNISLDYKKQLKQNTHKCFSR